MTDTRTKTYRSRFCKSALIPQLLPKVFSTLCNKSILDFGCGKDAYWVDHYRNQGLDIDGIDLSRPDLKACEQYDIVMLSNVVNVQETHDQLCDLVNKVKGFDPKFVIFNYPSAPRKMDSCNHELLRTTGMKTELAYMFGVEETRFVSYGKNCFVIRL